MSKRAYWLPINQLVEWPSVGEHVIYRRYKNRVPTIHSGVVVGEKGEIQEHGTGKIHRPYGSDIFTSGTEIPEVGVKLT